MPRPSDPEVEGRILKAARKLWHKGGEDALSMRAVAKAAGTNTPAVYRRFRTREKILRALVQEYQQQLLKEIAESNSAPEAAERILDFALDHRREYELITSGLLARMTKERPSVEFIIYRCAEWMGGSPKDHEQLVLSIWALVHGMAMLRISGTMREEDYPRARMAFTAAVNLLLENAQKLRI
jgi:AcrR family transcriptional regulator